MSFISDFRKCAVLWCSRWPKGNLQHSLHLPQRNKTDLLPKSTLTVWDYPPALPRAVRVKEPTLFNDPGFLPERDDDLSSKNYIKKLEFFFLMPHGS